MDNNLSNLSRRHYSQYLFSLATLIAICSLCLAVALPAYSQGNPIFAGADPDVLVDGRKFWIFPTTEDEPKQAFYAYSSPDLKTWSRVGPILKERDISWLTAEGVAPYELWAPGIFKNAGRYYLFYAVSPQNQMLGRIGVASSDALGKPFRDSGKPLVLSGADFEAIDPMVFKDPHSGKIYLYCGGSAGADMHVYQLNKDCISIEKEIAVDRPHNYTEGPFMHMVGNTYYLSYSHGNWTNDTYSVCYSTAPSPIGPWTYKGEILSSNQRHAGPGHHSIFKDPRTSKWYVVYHRWNNGRAPGKMPAFRSVSIDSLDYDRDGDLLPIVMTDKDEIAAEAKVAIKDKAEEQAIDKAKDEPEAEFETGVVRLSNFVSKFPFGKNSEGKRVWAYRLSNQHGLQATVITYGATLTSLRAPDATKNMANIVLGFDQLSQYEKQSPYFGATVGRVANRIAKASFTLDGQEYSLAANNGPNTLHGGKSGFDKKNWEATFRNQDDAAVTFIYTTADGEEGFPGVVKVAVTYTLTADDKLEIEYRGFANRATPINLTNHSYFNLAGAGSPTILNQKLRLDADLYTPVDKELIPTGAIESVKNTALDFTTLKEIGQDIAKVDGGYDHNFVIKRADNTSLVEAAYAEDTKSGRAMKVYTTEPGMQFYSGNFLDGTIQGNGGTYSKQSAFCLEAQHFPDSVHRNYFPNTILGPGEEYKQTTVYSFLTVPANKAGE